MKNLRVVPKKIKKPVIKPLNCGVHKNGGPSVGK